MKSNSMYELTYASYISDEDKYVPFIRIVTIPKETMNKLNADKKYPFYRFLNEDGLDIWLCYECIFAIEKHIK